MPETTMLTAEEMAAAVADATGHHTELVQQLCGPHVAVLLEGQLRFCAQLRSDGWHAAPIWSLQRTAAEALEQILERVATWRDPDLPWPDAEDELEEALR